MAEPNPGRRQPSRTVAARLSVDLVLPAAGAALTPRAVGFLIRLIAANFAARNACGVAEAAVSGGNPVSKISRIHHGSSGHVSGLELTTDCRSMTVNEKTPGKAKS